MAGARGREWGRGRARRRGQAAPLATGWGERNVGPAGEIVVAVFARERLGEALAAVHGAGYGHAARVFDGARGDLAGQLGRARIPLAVALPEDARERAVMVVAASGRSAIIAETLRGAGAIEVTPIGAAPARSGETWRRDGAPVARPAADDVLPEG